MWYAIEIYNVGKNGVEVEILLVWVERKREGEKKEDSVVEKILLVGNSC